MKLNFLNVMNKKSGPDEIAEQIVALEVKKGECERIRDDAKKACKEMRGKIMCGERVNAEAVKQADRVYDEALLDLETAEENLEELKKHLYVSLEARHEEESKKVTVDRQKWAAEKDKLQREIDKAKGRLVGLMMGVYRYESEVVRLLGDTSVFSIQSGHPNFAEFTAEKDRALSELRRPTPSDLEDGAHQKEFWLANFKLEEEYEKVLKTYRDQSGVTVPEAETASV